jgi:hypothetical protein
MAREYEHVSALAREIRTRREEKALSFEKLGHLAGVDAAQAFRICRGEFKTLNPSVLKMCNALGVQPKADEMALQSLGNGATEAMLSTEVLSAWDRTDAGAKFLVRVLRALRRE